tara:strand:+ start:2645 stop:4021 length:1377 start_codon:yes stop_codon:yes gene_type:complete
MPVSDKHEAYQENLPIWELGRDSVKGAPAIKKGGTKYLPMPNSLDQSEENKQDYADYKQRACYVNFTGQTKEGLIGMAFLKDAVIEIKEPLSYLEKSTDGGALSLTQFTRKLLGDSLEVGRSGILVDYPTVPDGLTKIETDGINANMLRYKAESIINWRTENINGASVLSLVVLTEKVQKTSDDGFSSEEVTYYRVLKLEEGVYSQCIYNDEEDIVSIIEPTKNDGSRWNEIPFTFVGSENNNEDIDKPVLIDIAEANIAHYRNSADYEESSFITGQPTPYLAGLTQGWVDSVLDGKIALGSKAAIFLPENGMAGLLQAAPNSMPIEGMRQKEEQMIKIGARIIADSSGTETAEAAKIRFSGQNSKLSSVIGNIEEAIKKSAGWVGEFMGGDGDIEFKLNRQFYDSTIDPQKLIANIQMLDRGVIGMTDFREMLRKAADITRTDEEIALEVSEVNPLI